MVFGIQCRVFKGDHFHAHAVGVLPVNNGIADVDGLVHGQGKMVENGMQGIGVRLGAFHVKGGDHHAEIG